MELPEAFLRMLAEAVGGSRADTVSRALCGQPSVSVRLNPFKTPWNCTEPFQELFPGSASVPWSHYGRILPERPSFTLDPLFHCGAYYVQESSAMFAGHLFRQQLHAFKDLGRPLRVLDLCAAPGGKTTDLACSLRTVFGDGFMLVANEVVSSRASELRDNVILWGDPCVVVTSSDPSAFASLDGFFDIILADVPCSGEGMFRKDAGALRMWSEDNVALCSARQRRILSAVWPAMAPGGILIYSTCTFNDSEDRDNVRWASAGLGAEIIPPSSYWSEKSSDGGPYAADDGIYLLPGLVPGEGQYCAALRKASGREMSGRGENIPASGRRASKPVSLKAARLPEGLFDAQMPATENAAGDITAWPLSVYEALPYLSHLKILRAGVPVGKWLKGRLVPDGDLVYSLAYTRGFFPEWPVNNDLALSYLRRQSVPPSGMPHGFVSLTYAGLALGLVNNIGTRTNNLLAKSRRIRI